VRIGVTMFATDQTIGIMELAREVEARGLASLYLPEHTHIPTSRTTPPPTGDAELAEEYKRTLDPLVALAMAAAVTTDLVVGTGILLPAQRDPIVTAKAVATLDSQSGGRFRLGVGFGWNEDELAHHGVAMRDRREVTRERIAAMRALWQNDVGEFHGDHVDFSPSWSWPKCAQQHGPPVWIGGAPGPKLLSHVADYADGWLPIGGAGVRAALDELRRLCAQRDRAFEDLEIIPFGTIPEPGKLSYYADLGINEVVLRLPGGTRDAVLPHLDAFAELVG
jgi:probable F420-dependent oxidoreductase